VSDRMHSRAETGRAVVMAAVTVGVWLTGLSDWKVSPAQGACAMERESADQPVFVRHLGSDCTEQEREARAVRADEVFAALKQGRSVNVAGAMVVGDLFLDALPPARVETLTDLPPAVRDALRARQIAEVRKLTGPIVITRSIVRGAIVNRLRDSAIVVQGPVTLTGTTFERTADFSHTVFLGEVDGSETVFLSPALFVQARFTQPVRFEQTAFGPHTRFHRSVFSEPVSFLRAGFNGLSEFLEVTFDKEAGFSRAYFKMGTGFSGSRFGGILDFSEAVFEREVFFTFTVFEQDAYFRRAIFRGTADFSDAHFKGLDDFSKVMFDAQPNFSRVKVSGTTRSPGGLQDPRIMYGIAAVLAIFTLGLLWSMRKP
jgi:uncharacterized protein YjbI with pentapeptide repeats